MQEKTGLSNPDPKTKLERDGNNSKGFAAEDTPVWAPPESKPEPRPQEPIMNPSQPSTPNPI